MTVRVDAAETDGQFSLVEINGRSGGPPRHVHEREDEMFYVLEGKLKVFRGDEELVIEAGDSAVLPRRIPHTYEVTSYSARWLAYITPAGFEDYFRKLGCPAEKLAPQERVAAPDMDKLVRVGKEFGLTFLP